MTKTFRFSLTILSVALIIGGLFYYYGQNRPSADITTASVNLSEIIDKDFADQGKLTIDVTKLETDLDSKSRPVIHLMKEVNNKTYIAGPMTEYKDPSTGTIVLGFYVSRFDAEGSIDTTYDGGLSLVKLDYDGQLSYLRVADMAVQVDDSVLVLLSYLIKPTYTSKERIIKLLPNGKVDTNFGIEGRGIVRDKDEPIEWEKILIQADKKIVVAGNIKQETTLKDGNKINSFNIYLTRFMPNGQRDITFGDSIQGSGTTVTRGTADYQYYLGVPIAGIMDLWSEGDEILVVYGSGGSYQYSYDPIGSGELLTIAHYKTNGTLNNINQFAFTKNGAESVEGFIKNPYWENTWFVDFIRSEKDMFLVTESINVDNNDAWINNIFSFNQEGELNQDFGNKGIVQIVTPEEKRIAYTDGIFLDSSNRLVAYGSSSDIDNGTQLTEFYRIDFEESKLDSSFGQGGFLTIDNQVYYDREIKLFSISDNNVWWTMDNDTGYVRYFGGGGTDVFLHKLSYDKLNSLSFAQDVTSLDEEPDLDEFDTDEDLDTGVADTSDTSSDTSDTTTQKDQTVTSSLPSTNAAKYCTSTQGVNNRDLNGDGRTDLLAYNPLDGTTRLDLFEIRNNMTQGVNQWESKWELGWCHYLGYFNNDKYADKLSYRPTDGTAAMMTVINDQAHLRTAWTATWDKDRQLIIGDYNGDQLDDAITYNPDTGATTLYLANNDSTMTQKWTATWDKDTQLYAGDYNNDQIDDLLKYNKTTGNTTQNLADRNANLNQVWQTTWVPGWTMFPGDFNGDKRTDLLAYNPTTGAANLSRAKTDSNLGEFAYTSEPSFPATWEPGWTIIAGNFDGTGPVDAIFYKPDPSDTNAGQTFMDIFSNHPNFPDGPIIQILWRTTWATNWHLNK